MLGVCQRACRPLSGGVMQRYGAEVGLPLLLALDEGFLLTSESQPHPLTQAQYYSCWLPSSLARICLAGLLCQCQCAAAWVKTVRFASQTCFHPRCESSIQFWICKTHKRKFALQHSHQWRSRCCRSPRRPETTIPARPTAIIVPPSDQSTHGNQHSCAQRASMRAYSGQHAQTRALSHDGTQTRTASHTTARCCPASTASGRRTPRCAFPHKAATCECESNARFSPPQAWQRAGGWTAATREQCAAHIVRFAACRSWSAKRKQ